MNIMKPGIVVLVTIIGVYFTGVTLADSPVSLESPDSHSVVVSGKINLYRVQVEGMNLGEGNSKANAEVFVTLDSQPGMVYSLALHDSKSGKNVVNQEIANTLRAAYVNKVPVTLYHQISIKKNNNLKILMVQLN